MCEDCYNRYLTLVKKKLTAYSTPASKSFFTKIASSAEYPDSVRKIAATWLEESASSEHEGYNLPLTTGFHYDGYTITNYLGVISGDSFIGTGLISDAAAVLSDAFGTESDKLRGKMEDDGIKEIASRYAKSPAQLLLRWNIQQGIIPIPKTKNSSRLIENISDI